MDKIIGIEWLPDMLINLRIDHVFLFLSGLVVLIAILVAIFSFEYMKGDKRVDQYYSYLFIFVLSMIGLLISDHLILLFVFWELVGFSSYLLIGFWYKKEGVPQSQLTAFMVNRVADVCLLIGVLMMAKEGSLNISEIKSIPILPSIFMALGAFGKSAQLPFSGWLTKAMVGPTPISALIHAATMVAAGVYLLFRIAPLMPKEALYFIAIVGSITTFYGGLSALNQTDIKKVLAYSTISQLGYMMIGIGVGARDMALFHLWTHAFFKAGLFLAAGSIIHMLHKTKPEVDAQDIRNMGDLRRTMPFTFIAFAICAASLVGLPFFSGFLSKEGIINHAIHFGITTRGLSLIVPVLSVISVFLTAFYVVRAFILIFFKIPEIQSPHWKEPKVFIVPMALLSFCSLWFFHAINPLGHHWYLLELLDLSSEGYSFTLLPIISLSLIAFGGYLAFKNHRKGLLNSVFWSATSKGFYLSDGYSYFGNFIVKTAMLLQWIDDKIVDRLITFFAVANIVFSKALAIFDRFVIDGSINWLAKASQFLGKCFAALSARHIQAQLLYLLIGLILIFVWFLF